MRRAPLIVALGLSVAAVVGLAAWLEVRTESGRRVLLPAQAHHLQPGEVLLEYPELDATRIREPWDASYNAPVDGWLRVRLTDDGRATDLTLGPHPPDPAPDRLGIRVRGRGVPEVAPDTWPVDDPEAVAARTAFVVLRVTADGTPVFRGLADADGVLLVDGALGRW